MVVERAPCKSLVSGVTVLTLHDEKESGEMSTLSLADTVATSPEPSTRIAGHMSRQNPYPCGNDEWKQHLRLQTSAKTEHACQLRCRTAYKCVRIVIYGHMAAAMHDDSASLIPPPSSSLLST